MSRYFLLTCLLLSLSESSNAQAVNWHPLQAEGNAMERHENALVRAGDTFILLGGRGLMSVDLFNTQTNEWTRGAQPPFEIHHIQAVELDGLVYVIGALTGGWPFETPLPNILIYDPVLDTWAIGPEIPADRRRGAAGVVTYNNKIYVACGIINGHRSGWVNWLDEFDPSTNEWRKLPDAPRSRDHFHAAVIDDKLYVAGGRRSGYASQGFAETVKETDVFDFNSQQWTELPSPEGDIPTERAGTAAAVYDGNLLIIGGESGSQEVAHNEVEMLDVHSGSWQSLSPLLRGRHGTQAIYFEDMVFIGAGSGNRGGGPELNSFEFLAPGPDAEIQPNPLERANITASADDIVFLQADKGDTKKFTIDSGEGNQASLISYIQLDNSAAFTINLPVQPPFTLAPGQKIPVEVIWNGNVDNPKAEVLIKTLGRSEPISVNIRVEINP